MPVSVTTMLNTDFSIVRQFISEARKTAPDDYRRLSVMAAGNALERIATVMEKSREFVAVIDEVAQEEARQVGAEAMRAACWEAVQPKLIAMGIHPADGAWFDFKAAIEGATP
jgi:hypothetical protein